LAAGCSTTSFRPSQLVEIRLKKREIAAFFQIHDYIYKCSVDLYLRPFRGAYFRQQKGRRFISLVKVETGRLNENGPERSRGGDEKSLIFFLYDNMHSRIAEVEKVCRSIIALK
jgi:hypothetical protein